MRCRGGEKKGGRGWRLFVIDTVYIISKYKEERWKVEMMMMMEERSSPFLSFVPYPSNPNFVRGLC